MRKKLSTLIVVAAALAMVVGTAGLASAHHRDRPLPRPVHVEATFSYLDGTTKALIGDRGQITAVDADSLTLLRPDDVEVTVGLSAETCIRVDGQEATWEDLTVGDPALAISQPSAAGGLAGLAIHSGDPLLFRPDRPGCGLFEGAFHGEGTATFANGDTAALAWDKGRISGLAPHLIRIERLDGASVTAAVDRRTHVCGARSFRALHLGEPVWMISLQVNGDPSDLVALVIHRIRV